MRPPPFADGPVHHLSPPAAAALWEHVLARQGLAPETRLASAVSIADAALGLHAARAPSPYAILAARAAEPTIPATLFTLKAHQDLLTVRCMRKTLHTLPVPLAAAAHTATLRFRARAVARAAFNAGLCEHDLGHAISQLLILLRDGPLGHRVIERKLASTGTPIPAAKLAIKSAWEHGRVVYRNTTRVWNRETRTFALPTIYPGLDLTGHDRAQALTTLAAAYLDRYGPATLRDATWWSGQSQTDILTGIAATGRPLVLLATPWAADPALMFADRYEEIRTAPRPRTGVNLLAHEDTALKAYHQTRARYLGSIPPRRAFNQIGEALPTVLVDGQIAGTWEFVPTTRAVRVNLIRGSVPPSTRRAIAQRADEFTATLRAAWAAGPPAPPATTRQVAQAEPVR